MSNYSDNMVATMTKKGAYTYAEAVAFAEEHNLSARSVVSKIKSLGLDYTPKPKAASKTGEPRTRKADLVANIATAIGANHDALSGLAKADMRALEELIAHIDE